MRLAHTEQFTSWYRLLRTPEMSERDKLAAMGGAAARILRSRKGWSTVHGPVAATLMTAIRLGCSIHSDGSITDHRSIKHDIQVDGIKRVEEAMQDAHDDWAESMPRLPHNKLQGLTAEARMLANKCKKPMHKFAIPALLSGADRTQAQLVQDGALTNNMCRACGQAHGTRWHRMFVCKAYVAARKVIPAKQFEALKYWTAMQPLLLDNGRMSSDKYVQYQQWQMQPKPTTKVRCDERVRLICTDGGATHPSSPVLRVAAWAWAAYDAEGQLLYTNRGWLQISDSPRQT
eukprot:3890747-Amphidinium_carterae.3